MKHIIKYCFFLFLLVSAACQEDYELGSPVAAELALTPIANDPNRVTLVATTQGGAAINRWNLGNGQTEEGDTIIAYYPFQGEYEVVLTSYSRGGTTITKSKVSISQTDPAICQDATLKLLTGGCEREAGKTWVIDAGTKGHFGLGPRTANGPDWYQAGPNEKVGGGLYNDLYTFRLTNYQAIIETNGDVYLRSDQASNFAGATPSPVGDHMAPFTAPTGLSYVVQKEGDKTFLRINGGGFLGYYTGITRYEIITLTENLMVLKYFDAKSPDFAWFLRLIPEGETPPPPPPPATSTLPITFEGATAPPFNGFGGTTYEVVDNPSPGGINSSAKVGKYVKGMDGNWAGIETALNAPLDFSENTLIKYKVYSPVKGRALFKLEKLDAPGTAVEVFAEVTEVNTWQELSFDFSAAASGTYNKVALFLDFDNNAGGTFYLDDIRQEAVQSELTLAALSGGGTKSWKLKPAAGSFGVGPAKRSDAWWPNGADITADRPCLFNDDYIFKTGGLYEYKANGDVFAEEYMGVNPGACTNESALADNVKAWGSGTHSFTLTPATATAPAYITVSGTGAFIGLAKAYNGGEYAAGPPPANGSVKYEVLSYVKNANAEVLRIAVDISAAQDGTAFWNFVLVPR